MNTGPINSRAIMLGAVLIIGLLGALAAGRFVAQESYLPILMFAAVAGGSTVLLVLGKQTWVLIPFTWAATGAAGVLPIPFNYSEMGIMTALAIFIAHLCFKQQSLGFKVRWIDLIIFINLAYLITVYARNPIGANAMGGNTVGGRTYFSLGLSFVAYLVLSHSKLPYKWARRFTLLTTIFMILPAALVAVSELFPPISKVIYPFYTGVSIETFREGAPQVLDGTARIYSLQEVARPVILALCAYYPPITLVNPLYFGRCSAFVITVGVAGLTGFRSLIMAISGYVTISTLLRRRFQDIFILVMIGVMAVMLVFIAYLAGLPVPFSIQRSLAFLPIGWDQQALDSAEDTKEWRIQMWIDAIQDPNVIKNKVLGDGFGYSREDMMIFSDELLGIGGFVGTENTYESFLIRGSFHNGPLSAIRFTGVVGLILLTVLFGFTLVYSVKIVRFTKGTTLQVLAYFVAVPMIYHVFEFFFIIGAYDNALRICLFSVGMYKMIENSLPNERPVKPLQSLAPEAQASTAPVPVLRPKRAS